MGTTLFLSGQLNQGTFISYLIYSLYVAHALGAAAANIGEFFKALGASDRIFNLIDRVPHMNVDGGKVLQHLKGVIEFKNVKIKVEKLSSCREPKFERN